VAEASPAEPLSGSKSRLRTEAWDFGVISPGTELRHSYTIRNDGVSTWTIKHVIPSCSCTLGEFTSRTVKPTESASLEIVFRAGKGDGLVYQAIMVEFAESDAPFFNLAMRGEIRGLLSPSPPIVDFGRVDADTRPSRTIELRNYSDQDLKITSVQSPDWLLVEHQPGEKAGPGEPARQTWRIIIRADVSKYRDGPEPSTLVIHTNATQIEPVVVPVNLRIRRPLEAAPYGFDFRIVPVGKTGQQALMLDVSLQFGALTEKDLVVTHNLGDELQIQVFKMADANRQNRFRLVGVFQPKESKGPIRGEMEIKVQGKTAASLRLPISALVR
jgi:hypothetical protein